MKLRIKKTGEVLEDVKFIDTTLHKITIQYLDDGILRECVVKNLSDIEEVKDYEEPKKYWYITGEGDICRDDIKHSEWIEERKSIGNYFETEEEAERAVEKLKALTEAKEDGLKIKGYYYNHEDLVILADIGKCNKLTLDTLFGKEID